MHSYRVAWMDDDSLKVIGYHFFANRSVAQIIVGDFCELLSDKDGCDSSPYLPPNAHLHHDIGRTFLASVVNIPNNHLLAKELLKGGNTHVTPSSGVIGWEEALSFPIIKRVTAPYRAPVRRRPDSKKVVVDFLRYKNGQTCPEAKRNRVKRIRPPVPPQPMRG